MERRIRDPPQAVPAGRMKRLAFKEGINETVQVLEKDLLGSRMTGI